MNPCKIWIDQCEATRAIEDQFGTAQALDYLIGEKFLNFLEAAETHADFREEIPTFVAEIKTIFERWQLAEYMEKARQREPFDPSLYDEEDDPEMIEMERQEDRHIVGRSAEALALYLFLLTVSDGQGLSYYSDATLGKLLPLDKPVPRSGQAESLGQILRQMRLGT